MIRRIELSFSCSDDHVFLAFEEAGPFAPHAVITLIDAGDMVLRAADVGRQRFLRAIGVSPARVASVRQVHSKVVVAADEPGSRVWVEEGGAPVEADGLVTGGTDGILAITVADCLPIYLCDEQSGAYGLVHSGWRGTGIVVAAIQQMRARYGSAAEKLHAIIGPGIGPCCYDVPEERAKLFEATFGTAGVRREGGRFWLDLRAANEMLLVHAGVRDITIVETCTACNSRLGSFRRQGPDSYSHMLALIGHFR